LHLFPAADDAYETKLPLLAELRASTLPQSFCVMNLMPTNNSLPVQLFDQKRRNSVSASLGAPISTP
jgi:hypothetical protein